MARQKKKKGGDAGGDMVPVIYARTMPEAEFYKGLLAGNDIPAVIEEESEAAEVAAGAARGVPVLVPDQMLDEASEILAEHEEAEEDDELNEYEDIEGEDELDEDFEDDELEDDEDLDDDEDLEEDEDELDEFDDELDDDTDDAEDLDEDLDE